MKFDIFTLLPLVIALFVFWRLRSVLGTRNGNEGPPPFNPYQDQDADKADGAQNDDAVEANDNVVTLPNARSRRSTDEEGGDAIAERIKAIAGKRKTVAKGLTAIRAKDPSFDPDEFASGAKIAYEMIVTAFADGDKRALKGLLSREVYDNFETVIDERVKAGEHVQASFVGIEKADIDGAEILKNEAQVTVKFVSQMISATLNEEGEVVDGDLQQVAEITDIWTFARSLKSRDPNWKLVATDA